MKINLATAYKNKKQSKGSWKSWTRVFGWEDAVWLVAFLLTIVAGAAIH